MNEKLIDRIKQLKSDRKAVILAHNYQSGEIQDAADFCGDSLGLSIKAAQTDAEVIIFCGVHFMAETAAILSPGKLVLMPDKTAGCPMADMITAPQLQELKNKHPDAAVVCYVNSSAQVKAMSDYCCTSANAVEVVNSLPADKKVIFVPDCYLGQYVAEKTGRDLILWPGHCPTHMLITEEDIRAKKAQYPDAVVMAHPECTQPVRKLADRILSTGQMLKFAGKTGTGQFIVATENGILHTLKKQNPDAQFIAANSRAVCPNMKKTTLDKVIWSLEDLKYKITVPDEISIKAKKAIDRMISILPEK